MARAPQPPHRRFDVRGWRRVVAELLGDHRCRVCGSSRWAIAAAQDRDVVTGLHYVSWPAGDAFGFTACTPVICEGCGLVETFADAQLAAWWDRRQAAGADADSDRREDA